MTREMPPVIVHDLVFLATGPWTRRFHQLRKGGIPSLILEIEGKFHGLQLAVSPA